MSNISCPINIKIKDIDIPGDGKKDPFVNDAANRSDLSDLLTHLVSITAEPSVFCLNAQWGEGKTTFLKMWEQYLKNNKFATIYFNAWENDFIENPMVALFGEIWLKIDSLGDSDLKKKTGKWYSKLVERKTILNILYPILRHLAKKNIGDETTSLLENIIKGLPPEADLPIQELDAYQNAKENMKKFKEKLQEAAAKMSKKGDSSNSKPLIFIIDDLDRCRPSFAIEILEIAKHIFNVPNIIFVLGVAREQLGISIKTMYGAQMDVDGYLRRFIDLDISLPPPKSNISYTSMLFEKYQVKIIIENINNNLVKENFLRLYINTCEGLIQFFATLYNSFNCSLREQEYHCMLFSVVLNINKFEDNRSLALVSFFLLMKIKYPDTLYRYIKEGRGSCTKVIDEVLVNKPFSHNEDSSNTTFNNSEFGPVLKTLLVACDVSRSYQLSSDTDKLLTELISNLKLDVKFIFDNDDEVYRVIGPGTKIRQNLQTYNFGTDHSQDSITENNYMFSTFFVKQFIQSFQLKEVIDKIEFISPMIQTAQEKNDTSAS